MNVVSYKSGDAIPRIEVRSDPPVNTGWGPVPIRGDGALVPGARRRRERSPDGPRQDTLTLDSDGTAWARPHPRPRCPADVRRGMARPLRASAAPVPPRTTSSEQTSAPHPRIGQAGAGTSPEPLMSGSAGTIRDRFVGGTSRDTGYVPGHGSRWRCLGHADPSNSRSGLSFRVHHNYGRRPHGRSASCIMEQSTGSREMPIEG